MQKILVTGSAGFIGGYLVDELLNRGYNVIGLDNFSKYGQVLKSYDDHPHYRLVEGDARDTDLMATNERIIAASCDAAIAAHRAGRLKKVTYMSSSMVYESADAWPSY